MTAIVKTGLRKDGTSIRVLYVEDDEENRFATAALLGVYGFEVIEAATAAEAASLLDARAADLDVAIVDLSLPDRDGWWVAGHAKSKDGALPVLLLTGWGGQLAGGEARSRGADGVLAKPADPHHLARTLVGMARNRGNAVESAENESEAEEARL